MKGKVAFITGSATGIGRAIALAFAQEGASVVIHYRRSQAEAETTLREVAKIGGEAILVQADVSDLEAIQGVISKTIDAFGRLDVLVNNSAITHPANLRELNSITEENWDEIFKVNVKGAFFCIQAAHAVLKASGDGCVLNITSAAGLTGRGSSIAYAASKGALITMTRSLALALAPEVRVNAIAPGFVPTRWHAGNEHWHPGIIQETPLQRLGKPEDIAQLAVALVTHGGFITGQTIVVDGGAIL